MVLSEEQVNKVVEQAQENYSRACNELLKTLLVSASDLSKLLHAGPEKSDPSSGAGAPEPATSSGAEGEIRDAGRKEEEGSKNA